MADVLGVDPLSERWLASIAHDEVPRRELSALVDQLLAERAQARAQKDFAAAGAVRARLLVAGIAIEDTPDGPVWTLKDA
jgi:cysteinyl-tRNA synthetase